MYLHIGQDFLVNTKQIIGVFDLDTSSISAHTRAYLAKAQQENRVVEVSADLPKSFIVTSEKKKMVYISPISSSTLLKRSELSEEGMGL